MYTHKHTPEAAILSAVFSKSMDEQVRLGVLYLMQLGLTETETVLYTKKEITQPL